MAGPDGELPDKLKNVEPKLIEHISNEIMDQDPNVRWDDIGELANGLVSCSLVYVLYTYENFLFVWFNLSWVRACKEMCHRNGYLAITAARYFPRLPISW